VSSGPDGQKAEKDWHCKKDLIEGFFFTQRGEASEKGRIFNAVETGETDIFPIFFSHCL